MILLHNFDYFNPLLIAKNGIVFNLKMILRSIAMNQGKILMKHVFNHSVDNHILLFVENQIHCADPQKVSVIPVQTQCTVHKRRAGL